MKRSSIQKYSLLGLVLVAASAVTAAVLPSNEDRREPQGKLVQSSAGSINKLTCVTTATPQDCSKTFGSTLGTTQAGATSAGLASSGNRHSSNSPA